MEGKVPQDMRYANIVGTLYKNKGDRSDCTHYRGVSLLSIVGRIFCSRCSEDTLSVYRKGVPHGSFPFLRLLYLVESDLISDLCRGPPLSDIPAVQAKQARLADSNALFISTCSWHADGYRVLVFHPLRLLHACLYYLMECGVI